MTKKNQDDRNTRAAEGQAPLLHNNVLLVQKESLDKKFHGVSAIDGARACLTKADNGNLVMGELATSLKRLSLEVNSGAYKSQADQIDAALLERAGVNVQGLQIAAEGAVLRMRASTSYSCTCPA